MPVSAASLKKIAIEADSFAEAEELVKTGLNEILEKYPKLKTAWDRGRFIRDLAQLAQTAATIAEAEQILGLQTGQLTAELETNKESADIWNRARLETTLQIKSALVKKAKEGSPAAIRSIESILRREIAHLQFDYHTITTSQLSELTGATRQTIHNWFTEHGLPRNSDKTYNLKVFIKWVQDYARRKPGSLKVNELDPLKAGKAEKLRIDIATQKGQLLDRGVVMAGILARLQALVNSLARKDNLAIACNGQPTDKIAEILGRFFGQILKDQAQVPEMLALPAEQQKKFIELLKELEPEGGEAK